MVARRATDYFSQVSTRALFLRSGSYMPRIFVSGGSAAVIQPSKDDDSSPQRVKFQKTEVSLVSDQSENAQQTAALLHAYRNQHPFVIIADCDYELFPFERGEPQFVVLGWYFVTHAWSTAFEFP